MTIDFLKCSFIIFTWYLELRGNPISYVSCVMRQQPMGVWNNCKDNEIPVGKCSLDITQDIHY